MKVQFSVPIEHPYLAVAAVLDEGPLSWLPDVGLAPEGWTSELAIGESDLRVTRRVLVTAGEVRPFERGLAVAIGWRAAEHQERYPALSGTLGLEPAGPATSRLSLEAEYLPPGGQLGAAIDSAVLHRVAEASVKELVSRIAERLERGVRFKGRWGPA